MVLAAEGFNTAIERLVDLVSPDYHPIAGDVKDVAAGAVLICAIAAAIIGAIIFTPYFLNC
jgi:diacylglycerol kinase (ATP)